MKNGTHTTNASAIRIQNSHTLPRSAIMISFGNSSGEGFHIRSFGISIFMKIEIPKERMWKPSPDELPKEIMMAERGRVWEFWIRMALAFVVWVPFFIVARFVGIGRAYAGMMAVMLLFVAVAISRLP